MILVILLMQFVLGGTAYHIATNTYDAIYDFLEVKNWLYSGYVSSFDYHQCYKKIVHWCIISIAFLLVWATLIIISVLLLTI